jgi:hypothetical protein
MSEGDWPMVDGRLQESNESVSQAYQFRIYSCVGVHFCTKTTKMTH